MSGDLDRSKQAGAAFVPTDEHHQLAADLGGLGLPHASIAQLIKNPETGQGISVNTLKKHFADDLERGRAESNKTIADTMHGILKDKDHPKQATVGIFMSKVHLGWKEDRPEQREQASPSSVVFKFESQEAAEKARASMRMDDAKIEGGEE